jgi:phosphoribosylaminoimidazolecarboxamide formyltransferase / IMP cyclohydrolase
MTSFASAPKTALISVSDKAGLAPFAKGLQAQGYRLLSTGGTLKYLQEQGLTVTAISDFTGSPEILEGRVKTLHPKIHGGLLGVRDKADHRRQMEENGIAPIDLVAVNLYPFQATVAKPDVTLDEAIENIDIGGPSMLRSAAKNHRFVTVVCDPNDYGMVLQEITNQGQTSLETRQRLAIKVFKTTADYDGAIDTFFSGKLLQEPVLRLQFGAGRTLRYGENDHQKAEFYQEPSALLAQEPNLGSAKQLHGKELSYNNLVDADAALEAVRDLNEVPAVAIIKHTNPCGYATSPKLDEAFEAAWQGDPVSAFGSVIACSRQVDLATAERLKGRFVELIIAPGFTPDALEFLTKKSKDIRVLDIGELKAPGERKVYKHILGGMLAQDRDTTLWRKWEVVTKAPFPDSMQKLARFTWTACKHVKSNAITMAWEPNPGQFQLLGIGPGQPNRIDSNVRLCQPRVRDNARRIATERGLNPESFEKEIFSQIVMASDAFFPFDDNVLAAHEAGIRYIVQPGGSLRDAEVIATADKLGIAMVFTGTRHFRH